MSATPQIPGVGNQGMTYRSTARIELAHAA
jgi:hypothetical protein